MSFEPAIDDRYFEEYVEGSVHDCGSIAVEANEVVAFAKRFDPQSIHTDSEAAKRGPFGGLIASGWDTRGLVVRLSAAPFLCPRRQPALARPRRIALARAGASRRPLVAARNCAQSNSVEIETRSRRRHLVCRDVESDPRWRKEHSGGS